MFVMARIPALKARVSSFRVMRMAFHILPLSRQLHDKAPLHGDLRVKPNTLPRGCASAILGRTALQGTIP
jgi:hypothetical protein